MGCLFDKWYWILRTLFSLMCLYIFGYKCPQIPSGQWGEEGEGWREKESDKGALLSAHFFPSLWGGRRKKQGVKHRPLGQLCLFCALCARRKTKIYETINISWLITFFFHPLWIFHPYLAPWLFQIPKIVSWFPVCQDWGFEPELGSCWWAATWDSGACTP